MTRTALAGITLAAALAGGCAPQPDPLIGAWRSSIQIESGAFSGMHGLEFMYVFNAGGTMTESSNYDAAPPVTPAYGTWRKTGPGTYELKYAYYSTVPSAEAEFIKGAGWMPSGHGLLTETITLDADGKSYTSTLKYDLFDLQGKPAEGSGTAAGKATRIGS
jgi:hypothetical protein